MGETANDEERRHGWKRPDRLEIPLDTILMWAEQAGVAIPADRARVKRVAWHDQSRTLRIEILP